MPTEPKGSSRADPGGGNAERFAAVVVGGGFYGGILAADLKAHLGGAVLLVEARSELMTQASFHNQARVHNGYHYPRSLITGARSHANFDRFAKEFNVAVQSDVEAYYAIARRGSKVTATQFQLFCDRIDAPLQRASQEVRDLFSPHLVEDVFAVREYTFDADKLRAEVRSRLESAGVDIRLGVTADRVHRSQGALTVHITAKNIQYDVRAPLVFNCTYSRLNHLLANSNLETLALTHEWTEMAIVEAPADMRGRSVTVMCGPFFSLMPFPPSGKYTLSHVRYTPHYRWSEGEATESPSDELDATKYPRVSRFEHMRRDAARYLPCMDESVYVDSLWTVKTILPRNEIDDGRPILFKTDVGLEGLTCVMGSKLDNVYDVLDYTRAAAVS
jgi:glycine/D-amino acid oxidase-like deaminating enzyme